MMIVKTLSSFPKWCDLTDSLTLETFADESPKRLSSGIAEPEIRKKKTMRKC